MKIIHKKTIEALQAGKTLRHGNIAVMRDWANNSLRVELFGNPIAVLDVQGYLTVSDAGYRTVTTKAHINALLSHFAPGYGIVQRDFEWYLSDPDLGLTRWYSVLTFNTNKTLAA